MKNSGRILFIILCWLICSGYKAQTGRIDSHAGIIRFHEEDTGRTNTLNALAIELKKSPPGSNLQDLAVSLGNIGSLYYKLAVLDKKFSYYHTARHYMEKSLVLCEELRDSEGILKMNLLLSRIDSVQNNFKNSLIHYRRYIAARDSISNKENTRRQTRIEMQFEFDKKRAADSVRVAGERKISAAELRAERNKSYGLYGGLGLVLIFSVFMYNRFHVARKQKEIIESQKMLVEEQKQMVEEKNKDILDSIHYAERIQRSLLPSEKYFEKIMKLLRQ